MGLDMKNNVPPEIIVSCLMYETPMCHTNKGYTRHHVGGTKHCAC